MFKRIFDFIRTITVNETLIGMVILLWIISKAFLYVPMWVNDIRFSMISGYSKQGTMALADSSLILKSPDHSLIIKSPDPFYQDLSSYCADNFRYYPSGEPVGDVSVVYRSGIDVCACSVVNQTDPAVRYKVVDNKIIYKCDYHMIETTLMPSSFSDKKG